MTMTQNEPPAADHRRLAEWELAKLDGDAVARDVAFAVVQSSPGGAVAGFETAATCHLNLMIAVAGEDGARRTLQAAALDASLTRIPPMTDPVAGDQAPEPEPAAAPDPEPAAADTPKGIGTSPCGIAARRRGIGPDVNALVESYLPGARKPASVLVGGFFRAAEITPAMDGGRKKG